MKGSSCGKPCWAVAALLIPVSLLVLTLRGASSSQKMSQTAMAHATATAAGPGRGLTDDLPGFQTVADFLASERAHVWLLSLGASVVVGLSGIFPLLVIPIEAGAALKTEGKSRSPRMVGRSHANTQVKQEVYIYRSSTFTAWRRHTGTFSLQAADSFCSVTVLISWHSPISVANQTVRIRKCCRCTAVCSLQRLRF